MGLVIENVKYDETELSQDFRSNSPTNKIT